MDRDIIKILIMYLVSIVSFNFALLVLTTQNFVVYTLHYLIMFISVLVTAFILEKRFKGIFKFLGFKKEKLLFSIFLGFTIYFIIFIPLQFFTKSEIWLKHFSNFSPTHVAFISFHFLFAALVEETAYMGYIFNKISEKNLGLAFIITGMLHASWHWPFAFLYGQYNYLGLIQNVISFIISIITGIIFLVTKRNIMGPTVFHAISNLVQLKL